MRTTKQLSITLPFEMAKIVQEHVVSGRYASESEVIRAGLRALEEKDKAFKLWLKNVAAIQSKLRSGEVQALPFDG